MIPVSVFDDLADARDLVGAIWMMAADLDEPAHQAAIRRVAEIVEKQLQAVIDLHEKPVAKFSTA
ncbi:hypothetical protein ASE23_15735 [Rhizobium sp. Root73]|uniref:hypothetical protein n=1 Tax=unclassified Rhizobium TaxID=2613769 RepID=UPI00072A514A|nr:MULTISPECIES: hypothetical protein [unclassified Rhizobium]KQY18168.1 hypothetical protein ASD36_06175 [Rhizobium sp. Root1334]KRB98469.1 hypothetical protein ASE23_15735 [Rhizobium sp. Root73]